MSSNPPNHSSGGFKGFLEKIGNTLSSFSPFAPKPIVMCPERLPLVEAESAVQPKPKVSPSREEAKPPWELIVQVRCVDVNRKVDTLHTPDSTVTVTLKPESGSEVSVSLDKDDFTGGIGRAKSSREQGYDIRTRSYRYEVTALPTNGEWLWEGALLDDGDRRMSNRYPAFEMGCLPGGGGCDCRGRTPKQQRESSSRCDA